jgi:hypothetical protein
MLVHNKEKLISIDEMMAILAAAKRELGGNAQLVRYDDGSDKLGVVRIESVTAENAVIRDLENGIAAWTLDEDKLGTPVRCMVLD